MCGLSTLNIDPSKPFVNLSRDWRPIAAKSRRYCQEDPQFIDREVERLLKEGIIEPSLSPWRAQVVVTKDENHKKRLAIAGQDISRKRSFPITCQFRGGKMTESKNGFRWRYEQNQLFKFVKNTIMAIAKC